MPISPSLQLLCQLERYSPVSVCPAPSSLSTWVQCFWHLAPQKAFSSRGLPESAHLYPDGGSTLLFNFADPDCVQVSLDFSLTRKSITFSHQPERLGIRFKPGALFALCQIEASELMQPAPLEGRDLEQRFKLTSTIKHLLQNATTVSQRFTVLRHWLESLSTNARALDVVQQFNHATAANAEHLLHNWPLSERQIERRFSQEVGVSARTLIQMRRIQYARALISFAPNSKLTNVALKAGYYDQSHFIKAFHKYVQTTPSQYRKRKSLLQHAF